MKIYSQNICWTKSKQSRLKIARFIDKEQPDFVCLQEVVFGYHFNSFLLPNYHRYWSKKLGAINKGGLVILSKEKAISYQFVQFSAQGKFNSFQLVERMISKGFLVAEFDKFVLINTHLVASHTKIHRDRDPNNLSQLNELLDFVDTQTKPIILAGDLNFSPKSKHYQLLTRHLQDQTKDIFVTFEKFGTKLDYICTTTSTNTTCEIVTLKPFPPSDHFGLLMKI